MQHMPSSQAIRGWSDWLDAAVQPKTECCKATSGPMIAEEALLHTVLLRWGWELWQLLGRSPAGAWRAGACTDPWPSPGKSCRRTQA